MIDLGGLGGTNSFAIGINASGQVIGYSNDPEVEANRVFITGANGVGVTYLETLGGTYGFASAVNASGQVAGYSTTSGNAAEIATITGPNGIGLISLGVLGGNQSIARAINDSGRAVGFSKIGSGDTIHAFITTADGAGMVDLNSFVVLAGGHFLTEATGINAAGQITAIGSNGRSYLLTPAIPEPQSAVLALAGLMTLAWAKKRARAC